MEQKIYYTLQMHKPLTLFRVTIRCKDVIHILSSFFSEYFKPKAKSMIYSTLGTELDHASF